MIKTVNFKMAMNSQLLTIDSRKQTEQTNRTETESQIWRSFGGLSVGRGEEEKREMVKRLRRIISRNKIDGDVKNCIRNGKAKELTCMTHQHE